jgi:hypothetical protein
MQKRLLGAVATTSVLALTAAVPAIAGEEAPPTEQLPERQVQSASQSRQTLAPGSRYLLAQIVQARAETWRWQRLMSKPRTQSSNTARRSLNPEYRRWVLQLWKARAAKERRLAHNPPRKQAWLCIFRHERHPGQGWATRTGNGFYGGLQMNISFQRTYAPELLRRKGTADRWSALEQIWVAERAYRSGRGFYPWPNTARYCGLI